MDIKETENTIEYKVIFRLVNEKDIDDSFFLEYIEQNKNKKIRFKELINRITKISTSNDGVFNFSIKIKNLNLNFHANLKKDLVNNILLELSPDNTQKIFNVQILIENSSALNSDIIIQYNSNKICFEIDYNDLKIGQVII